MFHFPGSALYLATEFPVKLEGFPHSEIFGSKVARHLPEAYRRHAASFIAFLSQGIHRLLLNFLLGNLKTTYFDCFALHFRWRAFACLPRLKRPTLKWSGGRNLVVKESILLNKKPPGGAA